MNVLSLYCTSLVPLSCHGRREGYNERVHVGAGGGVLLSPTKRGFGGALRTPPMPMGSGVNPQPLDPHQELNIKCRTPARKRIAYTDAGF